ncbi:MAG: hypothetical protein EB027_08180, partial [Actinobacteria bacterium]|nr:hypothetical protein [Actinomycetota bacterium]
HTTLLLRTGTLDANGAVAYARDGKPSLKITGDAAIDASQSADGGAVEGLLERIRSNYKDPTTGKRGLSEKDLKTKITAGLLMGSNKVSAAAIARITGSATQVLANSGAVEIVANSSPSLNASSSMAPVASSTLGGEIVGLLGTAADWINDAAGLKFLQSYTDRSGVQSLRFGDRVLFSPAKWQSVDRPAVIKPGERVRLLRSLPGADPAHSVYEYVGERPLERIDFESQDYADTALWKPARGDESVSYIYLGASRDIDLSAENFRDRSRWVPFQSAITDNLIGAVKGMVDDAIGAVGSDSTKLGINLLAIFNDVRSVVDATLSDATVTAAGDLVVEANQAGSLDAEVSS